MSIGTTSQQLKSDTNFLATAKGRLWMSRIVLGIAVGLVALGFWTYQSRNQALRAQRIEILDSSGKVAMIIGSNATGQKGLTLQDADGKKRCTLQLNYNGDPNLTLYDSKGVVRSEMMISPIGHSTLRMTSGKGDLRLAIGVREDGTAAVKVTDVNGKHVAGFTLDKTNTPKVEVRSVNPLDEKTPKSSASTPPKEKGYKKTDKGKILQMSVAGTLSANPKHEPTVAPTPQPMPMLSQPVN